MKKKDSVSTFMQRLDLLKPSREEMLKEISQSGLSISLENGNFDYLTNHKDELISTMWKVVKMSQMVDFQEFPQKASQEN